MDYITTLPIYRKSQLMILHFLRSRILYWQLRQDNESCRKLKSFVVYRGFTLSLPQKLHPLSYTLLILSSYHLQHLEASQLASRIIVDPLQINSRQAWLLSLSVTQKSLQQSQQPLLSLHSPLISQSDFLSSLGFQLSEYIQGGEILLGSEIIVVDLLQGRDTRLYVMLIEHFNLLAELVEMTVSWRLGLFGWWTLLGDRNILTL